VISEGVFEMTGRLEGKVRHNHRRL